MYPQHNQLDPDNPLCTEDSAYPANPDKVRHYGWEKLFSERPLLNLCKKLQIKLSQVARYHNIFGPERHMGWWQRKSTSSIM